MSLSFDSATLFSLKYGDIDLALLSGFKSKRIFSQIPYLAFSSKRAFMLKKLLSNSRYLVIVPVMGLLAASIALMGTGAYKIVSIVSAILQGNADTKASMLGFLETADLFLLAVALYLIALGLYDLFIDSDIQMPEWLTIRDLTDLKKKLVEVVVMILAVVFLGKVVNWDGGMEVFYLGAGIALVIAALTFFNKK